MFSRGQKTACTATSKQLYILRGQRHCKYRGADPVLQSKAHQTNPLTPTPTEVLTLQNQIFHDQRGFFTKPGEWDGSGRSLRQSHKEPSREVTSFPCSNLFTFHFYTSSILQSKCCCELLCLSGCMTSSSIYLQGSVGPILQAL